jgi:class III poly(R)-hydroxyalkanoic acid synthase PhaE subunit
MAGFTQATDAWTRAWLDMQKQYMETWAKLSPQQTPWSAVPSPFASAGGNPWADSFEQWSKLFGQGMPKSTQDISDRVFELGKSYLSMSESFWKLMQQDNNAAYCATDWQEALKSSFEQAGKALSLPGGADPWSGFATLWGLPLSNWQRMACSFSPLPGEMEKALRTERTPEPSEMMRAFRGYLSLPPVGYTREWQEQLQEWSELSMEYSQALQGFSVLLGKVVQRALELFGKRMTEKLKAGESFDGLRAIYDLWIDCGEEAYAEQAATTEFPHLQAELVNSLMRMKRHEQFMVEEAMTALNIPTRREMDTTHKRVYELQRQLRELQEALEDAAESETGAVRATPKAVRTAHTTAATKKAVTKKTATKKAATKKAATKKAATKKTGATAKRRPQTKTRKG